MSYKNFLDPWIILPTILFAIFVVPVILIISSLFGEYSDMPTHLIFDLSSVQFWGEDAQGTWTVNVKDVRPEVVGEVESLSLRLYGNGNLIDDQYVFTDAFATANGAQVLIDDLGTDWINTSAVSTVSSNVTTSKPSIAACKAHIGSTSVTFTRAPAPRNDAAEPFPTSP